MPKITDSPDILFLPYMYCYNINSIYHLWVTNHVVL